MHTVRMNRVPDTANFGRVCWAWDDIWLDSRREEETAKYYRAKYGMPVPTRVLDAVQEEGFCDLKELHSYIDGMPPKADDVAAPIDLNQLAGGAAGGSLPLGAQPSMQQNPQQQAQAMLATVPPPALDQLLERARGGQSPFPGIDPLTASQMIENAYRARGLTPPWPTSWKIGLGVGGVAAALLLGFTLLRRK